MEKMEDGIGMNDSAVVAEMLESATNVTEELMPGDINAAVNLMTAIINVSNEDVNTSVVSRCSLLTSSLFRTGFSKV